MKKSYIFFIGIFMLLTQLSHGQENVFEGQQYGDANVVKAHQSGAHNLGNVVQDGDGNSAETNQFFSNNSLDIAQEGDHNKAFVQQNGAIGGSLPFVGDFTIGEGNSAFISHLGEGNESMVLQNPLGIGGGNIATIDVKGDHNHSVQGQLGNASSASIYQGAMGPAEGTSLRTFGGSHNTSPKSKPGHKPKDNTEYVEPEEFELPVPTAGGSDNAVAVQVQEGNSNSATVFQYGRPCVIGNTALQIQYGTGNAATLYQETGNIGNFSKQRQVGCGNDGLSIQVGDGNTGLTIQNGNNNQAQMMQVGAGNISVIKQFGAQNGASVMLVN